MSLGQSWPLERGSLWTPRLPAPVRVASPVLCSTAVISIYLPDSGSSGSGGDRCTPRGQSRVQRAPHTAGEAPSAPAPCSLPSPLRWAAATQRCPTEEPLLQLRFALTGVPVPPAWVAHECLNSGGHSGAVPSSAYLSRCCRVHPWILPVQPACYLPPLPQAHCPPSSPTLWPLPQPLSHHFPKSTQGPPSLCCLPRKPS